MMDSHCHLDAEPYQPDWRGVLDEAEAEGVVGVMVPALHLESAERIQEMAAQDPRLAVGVGIHPHEADRYGPHSLARMKRLLLGAQAIGETGLEHHYDFVDHGKQLESLRAHLDLAAETGLPLILHCREAEEVLWKELETRNLHGGGVVHCFTGGWEWAQRFLDLGFHLGITGMVTFKKAQNVTEVARLCPLDRLLVETDGPYLAPVPYRGKTNHPMFIPLMVKKIAELRDCPESEVSAATTRNCERLFRFKSEVV